MATKGGCIIYFVDADGTVMVLTGKESNYVSDLKAAPATAEIPKDWTFKQLISYKEEVSGSRIDETVAKQKFSERALDLEKMLKIGEIRHDTPEEISSGRFKVHYRHLIDDCRKGVFKGGCEGKETPLQAAIRELREELGMNIPKSDLHELPGGDCLNCQMFTCDIGEKKRNFEEVIEARHARRYGELFEVSFKPLSAIMADIGSYNAISACALRRFNAMMNPPSASKSTAASSSSSSTKSPPRSPGSSSKKSPTGSSKKGGNKSKRNRSHAHVYARRRNKSYKQY